MLQRHINKMTTLVRDTIWALRVDSSALDDRPQAFQGPSRNYQKFIILAHHRSGSTMMISTLKKHPQIMGFGELFASNLIGFYNEGYDNYSAKLLYLRKKYPTEFLERYIFSSYRKDIRAVGFKLMLSQMERKEFQCIWEWLMQNKDIKIVLLKRRNLLATYTSMLIAKKTGSYRTITDDSQRTDTTVTINYGKCLNEFQKIKIYHEKALKQLKDHDLIEVNYEDITSNLNEYFKKFQQLLGIDIHPLPIRSIKKEIRPLSKVITNYSELRENLLNTEWEYLFEE